MNEHSFEASPCLVIPQHNKCFPAPGLVLRKPIFLVVLFSGGFFLFTGTGNNDDDNDVCNDDHNAINHDNSH